MTNKDFGMKSTMEQAPDPGQRCIVWDVAYKQWRFAYWTDYSVFTEGLNSTSVNIQGDIWIPEPDKPTQARLL